MAGIEDSYQVCEPLLSVPPIKHCDISQTNKQRFRIVTFRHQLISKGKLYCLHCLSFTRAGLKQRLFILSYYGFFISNRRECTSAFYCFQVCNKRCLLHPKQCLAMHDCHHRVQGVGVQYKWAVSPLRSWDLIPRETVFILKLGPGFSDPKVTQGRQTVPFHMSPSL